MEPIFARSAPATQQLAARNLQYDIKRIRDTYVNILEKRAWSASSADGQVQEARI